MHHYVSVEKYDSEYDTFDIISKQFRMHIINVFDSMSRLNATLAWYRKKI